MSKYYLGCDVSKGYADFVIIDDKKNVSEPHFTLDDTAQGHRRLYDILRAFFEKHPDAEVFAAVESTGGYENNWHRTLRSIGGIMPLKTARLNPRGVRHYLNAALKRTGTDKISALAVAGYQISHAEAIHYDQADEFKSMRRLFTAFRMFVKMKTQLLNQLETLLYTANPELVPYRRDNTPKWLLRLLTEYPLAKDLAAAAVSDLARIPYIADKRAQQIIASAENSVASADDAPTKVIIKTLAEQILQIDQSISTLKKEAQKFVDVPQIALLTSVKSIGLMSAVGLYVELGGCIAGFASAKQLASFWGLHPMIKQSGDGNGIWGMSKQGRKLPRAILFMVALNGIQTDPFIQNIYHRQLKKGKSKMAAVGICMHKLARIVFGVLKNNTPFDPAVDKLNQMRSKPKTGKNAVKPNARRFQKEDRRAPISRRQTLKRREREASQGEPVTINEISLPAPAGG